MHTGRDAGRRGGKGSREPAAQELTGLPSEKGQEEAQRLLAWARMKA